MEDPATSTPNQPASFVPPVAQPLIQDPTQPPVLPSEPSIPPTGIPQSIPPAQPPIQNIPSQNIQPDPPFSPPSTSFQPSKSKWYHSKVILGSIAFVAASVATITYLLVIKPESEDISNNLTVPPVKTITAKPTLTPTPALQPLSLSLTIDSPIDGTLAVDNKITVKGKTLPKSTVMFYTDSDQNSVESDDAGAFSGDIILSPGINTLTIIVYSTDGEEKSVSMNVANDSQTDSTKTQ